MRNIYVFDTSVLVHDPMSWKQFSNSDILIPIAVLDELDKLKKQPNDAGKNARVMARLIDGISETGDISTGIVVENDILFKIDTESYPTELFGDSLYGDTRIIACAFNVTKTNPDSEVILVTNDINLRVRARALGMLSEGYNKDKASFSDIYEGMRTVENIEAGEALLTKGSINPKDFNLELNPNEFILFVDGDGMIASGRKVSEDCVKAIRRSYPWGLSPRNKEQTFAIDLISDPNVPLITLTGSAGTGKSLVTLATALELVLTKKQYDKFIIYRPIQPVGNDIGYIPGSIEEKLAPWFQAILDNFEVLFTSSNGDKWRANFEAVRKKDRIQMEALTYIRGRSIPNAIILVDEAQNLTKEDMKTILTRAGDNTKIILTGDISQIDSPNLDATSNGLTYVIEKFKESNLAGHITFTQGERSALATEASSKI